MLIMRPYYPSKHGRSKRHNALLITVIGGLFCVVWERRSSRVITTRLDARHLHEKLSMVVIEQPHTSTLQTINLYPQCIPTNAAGGNQTVVAFNSWHQPRYLCGNRIEPNSYLSVKEPCHEGIRVFPEEPGALIGIDIPPIDLILRSQTTAGFKATKHNCPVPCQEWGEV
jgi:hypothetical protein